MIVASNEAKTLGKMYNSRSWSKHVQTNDLKNEENTKRLAKTKLPAGGCGGVRNFLFRTPSS